MAQFRTGTVRVEQGQTTVRAIWESNHINTVGIFQAGEVVEFHNDGNTGSPADGSGVVASYSDANKRARFYRTAGAFPAVGARLVGVTSAAEGDVDTFSAGSPPRFDLELAGGEFFTASRSGLIHQVAAAGLDQDQLELTAPYGGATATDIRYGVVRDFSSRFSLPLPGVGDVDPSTAVARAIAELDAALERLVVSQAADFDVVKEDRRTVFLLDAAAGPVTATLPAVADAGNGFQVTAKRIDASANAVAVAAQAAELIDGQANVALAAQYDRISLVCDGVAWHRID